MLSSDKFTKIFFVIDEFCKNFNEVLSIFRELPHVFVFYNKMKKSHPFST